MLKSTPSIKTTSFSEQEAESRAIIPPSQHQLRHTLHRAYEQCRQATLALVQNLDETALCQQAHEDFSPVGWHLGHIAYTEALWILQRFAGKEPLFPEYHRLFAADGLPKVERQNLPPRNVINDYLDIVRIQVFDYLETAPIHEQERIWWFLLQHESQHCETMTLVAALLDLPNSEWGRGRLWESERSPLPDHHLLNAEPSMVCVPPGTFQMGSNAPDALDNERPAHEIHLEAFWIDRYPVTCEEFQWFIDAGGYTTPQWWCDEGWTWLQDQPTIQPLYTPCNVNYAKHPVCGVSWYEANAYARFVGKRLPTEAEWEKASRWKPTTGEILTYPWGTLFPNEHVSNHNHHIGSTSPVDAHAAGMSPVGCVDLLGNVWEWTASEFQGYLGFQPFPYVGYSKTYFDGQHYVLRGGSWATRPWTMRSSFRNWYHPWIRQIFAGFRCASSHSPHCSRSTKT